MAVFVFSRNEQDDDHSPITWADDDHYRLVVDGTNTRMGVYQVS